MAPLSPTSILSGGQESASLSQTGLMASSTQPQDYDLKSQVKPRPSYPVPSGIPFTFWEQYIGLGFYLLLALAAAFAAVFLLISVLLVSPLAASVIW